jgi:hypothetical protein
MNATLGIKAKETHYNGYRFRSRLEARWAVFFDALDIKYEYEKEGFDLSYLLSPEYGWTDGGAPGEERQAMYNNWRSVLGSVHANYLPDFWIPHLNTWIEIKGPKPTEAEEALAQMLAFATDQDVFVFYGDIKVPSGWDLAGTEANKHFAGGEGWDSPYQWCECSSCGRLGIEFDARSDRLDCKQCYMCAANVASIGTWREDTLPHCPVHGFPPNLSGCPRSGGNNDKGYNGDSPRLIAAYTAARQARFEHGESGALRR